MPGGATCVVKCVDTTAGTGTASWTVIHGTKRRIVTTNAPGATPSINTDTTDYAVFTGLNAAITSLTTNLTGTPTNGQMLEISFTDDGTARAITPGSSFANTGTVSFPTTTVISTRLRVVLEYSSAASKWEVVGVA